jgi:hypothetical protein
VSSQGAVHVFTHKTFSSLFSASSSFIGVQASAVADATLQNAPSFEYFGQSLEIASSLLLVGAPYYHNLNAVDGGNVNSAVGRVFAYSWNNGVQSEFSIIGCRHASRLGQSFAYSESLNVLAIAEPSYNVTKRIDNRLADLCSRFYEIVCNVVLFFTRFTKSLRAGRVLLVPLDAILSHLNEAREVNICEMESWPEVGVVEGSAVDGRFGSQLKFTSYSPTSRIATLVTSAPVSSAGGELYGVTVTVTTDSNNTPVAKGHLDWTVTGESLGEGKGRLGQRIAVPHAGLPNKDLVMFASLPLADRGNVAPDADEVGSVRAFVVSSSSQV